MNDGKPRILLVDDLQENVRVRALLLQQFGCDTALATDYNSTMQRLAEDGADLLLIDYHLAAGHTGEEIARSLRDTHPDLPMIMLTGDAKIPDSAYQCVDEVLIKGTSNPRDLLDAIQRLLPNAALRPPRPMLITPPPKQAPKP